MLQPADAWARLRAHLSPLGSETLARRQARGRAVAASPRATVDVPSHDVSAMDGYAVAGEVGPGERRRVRATVAAGEGPGLVLAAGEVARVMTGALMPSGADRVVPVELSDGGVEEVTFRAGTPEGAHVRRRGEIHRAGSELLPAGSLLTPGALALLATHGHERVEVVRAPRVAIVVTGDEVVPPEVEPAPGQLRDSHTDFLTSALRSMGLEGRRLGIAPDVREVLVDRIRDGLTADVLLLTGGVSMGEYDLVEGVLGDLGCDALFDGVAIQPGKPLVAARHAGGLVFALPGNPASVMVGFWLFVRPALRLLMGIADGFWEGALEGRLVAGLPGAGSRDRFLPAEVAFAGGRLEVRPLIPKGSHDVASYARGTALVRVSAGAPPAAAGEGCQVLPLGEWPSA